MQQSEVVIFFIFYFLIRRGEEGRGEKREEGGEIWVNECLMSPNGLLCDPAAEGQVGF